MNIEFSPPDISEEDIQAVSRVLRSGWITTGPETHAFEDSLAAFVGNERVLCLNSNTSGLFLALKMLGIGPGDQVITTPYTYTASASIITHIGAEIVFLDLAENSYEMDYDRLEEAITPRTKAIIAVDLGGRMCDYASIYKQVENKRGCFVPSNPLQEKLGRVAVIADGAHSLGAFSGGKRSGQAADITCFSFHAVKNITTAEGGAITWTSALGVESSAFYRQLSIYSLHGQTKDAYEKAKMASWEYDILFPAYKLNMTDISAALGLSQLKRYPDLLDKRRRLVCQYETELAGQPIELYRHFGEDFSSSCHLMITSLAGMDAGRRNAVIGALAEVGISSNVHYKPLPMHSGYKALGFDIQKYPQAYSAYEKELTLPLYSRLTEDQVTYITDHLKRILKNI